MRILLGLAGAPLWEEAECQFLKESYGLKFALDYAWTSRKIGIEIDGAVHRIEGRWKADMIKFNLAMLDGWRILHLRPYQLPGIDRKVDEEDSKYKGLTATDLVRRLFAL